MDPEEARNSCMKFLRNHSKKTTDIEIDDWPTVKREFETFLIGFPFAQYTVNSANKSKKKGPVEEIASLPWILKVVKHEMLNPESMTEDVKHHLAYFSWIMGRDFFE